MAERSGWATPNPDGEGWRRPDESARDRGDRAAGTDPGNDPGTDPETLGAVPADPPADSRWARPDTRATVAVPSTGDPAGQPEPTGRPEPTGQPVSWGRPALDKPTSPAPPPGDWAQPGDRVPPGAGPGRWGTGGADQGPPQRSQPDGDFFRPPKPGIIPLRALGVSEILDGAFANVRQNPGATFGLTGLVMTTIGLVNLALDFAGRDASDGSRTFLAFLSFVIALAAQSVVAGMLSVVVSEAVLGIKITLGEAFGRLRGRLRGLVLLGFTVLGLAVVPGGLVLLGFAALGLTAVGALVFLVWVGYVSVLCSLSGPAFALEGGRVRDALVRSRGLTAGARWRTCGIILLIGVVALVITAILMIPFSLGGSSGGVFGGTAFRPSTTALFIGALGNIVSYTIAIPIMSGGIALLYVDRRIRVEGLDMTLARAARDRAGA